MNGRVILLAVLVTVLLPATPAQAATEGPCTILVQGQDVSGEGTIIAAPADGNLSYSISAPIPVLRWSVTLHYGPIERLVLSRDFEAGATSEQGHFAMGDHTKYGKGLYRVTGDAELSDGTSCFAEMGLRVEGNPFTTVLGVAALALLGAAGVGLLLLVLQIILDAKDVVEAAKDFAEQVKHVKPVVAGVAAASTNKDPDPPAPDPPR